MSIQLSGCDDNLLTASREGTEFMMGIDEAGRGPTLGPMVYGSAFCAVEDEHRIRSMGFNDSKQLTETKRDQLWEQLQECGFLGWEIRVLQAREISEGMLRKHGKYNLNAMSHDAAIGLVRKVMDKGINLKYLYVDTVGDPDRYRQKLEGLFPSLVITVEKKADSKFPVVSAASICAKVPRDAILGGWRFEDGAMGDDYNWGCGYPSDKDTQRWMKDNLDPIFGWPDVVRFSWGPALEVLQKEPRKHSVCEVRWPAEDGEEATQMQQQRDGMASFLGLKRRKVERHRMIEECLLEPVESF